MSCDTFYQAVDHVLRLIAEEDTSLLVSTSVISVSILMTFALLCQGNKDSIFQVGLGLWGHTGPSIAEIEEKAIDEAEREIFQEGIKSEIDSAESVGIDIFMSSKIPLLTLIMAAIAVLGAVHVAFQQSQRDSP
jgi:hypothetical protein